MFEDLIRRFTEQSNETAGEHFSPRQVIKLMVNVLFNADSQALAQPGIVKTLNDPACGTGGMLSIGEQHLCGKDTGMNPQAKLELFGKEIYPESYAICKSDMLIKGQNPANIKFGNSFTLDGLKGEKFEYMLSKMKPPAAGSSRIGIVFNGSPLFTGQAGSGERNIRQWIIENDWLEVIIAVPDQLFYNTGISTYVWILNNHKSDERKGKIRLINATGAKDDEQAKSGAREHNRFWEKMPRSLGNKRKQIPENGNGKGIGFITRLYGDFEDNEFVKILPNAFFGYWRVTVEQPLTDEEGHDITSRDGSPKSDPKLLDFENIPFLQKDGRGKLIPQTIEEYVKREVKPHLLKAWIDESKTKTGYHINFTKYFYEFKPLR